MRRISKKESLKKRAFRRTGLGILGRSVSRRLRKSKPGKSTVPPVKSKGGLHAPLAGPANGSQGPGPLSVPDGALAKVEQLLGRSKSHNGTGLTEQLKGLVRFAREQGYFTVENLHEGL